MKKLVTTLEFGYIYMYITRVLLTVREVSFSVKRKFESNYKSRTTVN